MVTSLHDPSGLQGYKVTYHSPAHLVCIVVATLALTAQPRMETGPWEVWHSDQCSLGTPWWSSGVNTLLSLLREMTKKQESIEKMKWETDAADASGINLTQPWVCAGFSASPQPQSITVIGPKTVFTQVILAFTLTLLNIHVCCAFVMIQLKQ